MATLYPWMLSERMYSNRVIHVLAKRNYETGDNEVYGVCTLGSNGRDYQTLMIKPVHVIQIPTAYPAEERKEAREADDVRKANKEVENLRKAQFDSTEEGEVRKRIKPTRFAGY